MSKPQPPSGIQIDKKSPSKQRSPIRVDRPFERSSDPQGAIPDPLIFNNGMAGQASLLRNPNIPAVQRQKIASQINGLQHNRHLQKILFDSTGLEPYPSAAGPFATTVDANPSVAQRTNLVIQLRDLNSPRFAGDPALEAIFNGTGTLKRGDESESVRKVQHGIHDSGILFLGHGVEGKFGRETEAHVRQFQTRNRISGDPSGEVGSATMEKLDQLFPQVALPASATDPFTFDGMLELLCQWNSAMIRDLRSLHVQLVADLEWADEEFDGSGWVPHPMSGAGETIGSTIIIATDDTNENVSKTLYHEYQHARSPVVFRTGDWGSEESRVYDMETHWAIERGITPDPTLTTTNPTTGEVEVDPGGIASTVESYPGLGATNPGEVIAKVGRNRVRVRMPDGSITTRNAVAGDTVPGPRRTTAPRHNVRDAEWVCP
jgi:hypothetical protein